MSEAVEPPTRSELFDDEPSYDDVVVPPGGFSEDDIERMRATLRDVYDVRESKLDEVEELHGARGLRRTIEEQPTQYYRAGGGQS